jgi:CBS domain containing-hemolysin-like protein
LEDLIEELVGEIRDASQQGTARSERSPWAGEG